VANHLPEIVIVVNVVPGSRTMFLVQKPGLLCWIQIFYTRFEIKYIGFLGLFCLFSLWLWVSSAPHIFFSFFSRYLVSYYVLFFLICILDSTDICSRLFFYYKCF
jgi:hypothetical protein